MGARHEIGGLTFSLQPAQALGDEAPLPYYLATGATVKRAVRRGEILRGADVEVVEGSTLLSLRRAQDKRFFG